jgi:hypothetical protein
MAVLQLRSARVQALRVIHACKMQPALAYGPAERRLVMRKTLAAGLAALTFGGAVAAAAVPAAADARPYYGHGGYYHRGHGDAAGAAVVAGIAGLALGAALADNHPHYYHRGYYAYDYPAYDYGYGYGYGPRVCESRHWTWDPYIGRRVLVTSHYAC